MRNTVKRRNCRLYIAFKLLCELPVRFQESLLPFHGEFSLLVVFFISKSIKEGI